MAGWYGFQHNLERKPDEYSALDPNDVRQKSRLIELAKRFGVISEDEPKLPAINYYDISDVWFLNEASTGRLIELEQYPSLHNDIRKLRREFRQRGVVVAGQAGSGA